MTLPLTGWVQNRDQSAIANKAGAPVKNYGFLLIAKGTSESATSITALKRPAFTKHEAPRRALRRRRHFSFEPAMVISGSRGLVAGPGTEGKRRQSFRAERLQSPSRG